MTISYNWLKDYLKFDLSPEQVGVILTDTGLEVEHIETVEQIPGGLEGVVVAEVVECVDHPDSDHLHVTQLNVGGDTLLQVVCGAPNVASGEKVLLATIGTKLPTPDGSEFKIKKSKIRGVESNGMICAEDELGIGSDHSGIMVLKPSAVPGTPAREYLQLKCDTVYEIGLTPNRIDGASHIGCARDIYAWCAANGVPCRWTLPDLSSFKGGEGNPIPVEVLEPQLSPRYIGITISGVKVGPSPDWIKERLQAIGQRPINNVVDITNFVMNEMGHPLHAFDASKITGGRVIVRRADEGARFTTLDGVERTLSGNDLMICNTAAPMCIAGVFGGADSGTTESTTDIFLEAAYFNPVSIRKTSKRHGLKTDASFRYERGIDPAATMLAAKRAAILIRDIAGGRIVGQPQEFCPEVFKPVQVGISYGRIASLAGKDIGSGLIKKILVSLDFKFISETDGGAVVEVPSYRVDVTRECDIVEEILRIYGYNNIELPSNMKVSINSSEHPDPEAVRSTVSNMFASWGFSETMNNSLTKGDYYDGLKTFPKENLVKVVNPLSSDLNSMRQTLLLNALEVISYNINRQNNNLRIFELGNCYKFSPKEGGDNPSADLSSYSEQMRLCFAISGPGSKSWHNEVAGSSYFALKGYLETLLKRFSADLYTLEYDAAPSDLFSEGLEYRLQGERLAMAGTVNPALAKKFDIRQSVFAAEISWPVFFKLVRRDKVKYKEMPKYPEVRRDLALLLDEDVRFSDLRDTAFKTEKSILKQVVLFDVYRGDKIPGGKKQYAISFYLQDEQQTLTDDAVERVVDKLMKAFSSRFSAVLR